MIPEFKPFDKIPRLNREVVITEKIDGTNACVVVVAGAVDKNGESFDDRKVFAQSRNRSITPEADNFGFAQWVQNNAEELKQLGPGYHYGEWWGSKVGRQYGLSNGNRIFSLFNSWRWVSPKLRRALTEIKEGQCFAPDCCDVVPILPFHTLQEVPEAIEFLKKHGSQAYAGFMDPEGVMVWHVAASQYFKVTVKDDASPKSLGK